MQIFFKLKKLGKVDMVSDQRVFCGFCGLPLEDVQIDVLKEGESIYCSSCGHKITPSVIKLKSKKIRPDYRSSVVSSTQNAIKIPKKTNAPKEPIVSDFKTFQKSPYTIAPENKQPVDSKAYSKQQSENKKRYKAVQRHNTNILLIPIKKDKKLFLKKKSQLKRQYQKIKRENKHEFELALLHNENSDNQTLNLIRRDYIDVKRRNRKHHRKTMKKFKKDFRKTHHENMKTYHQIVRQNRKQYAKIKEHNEDAFDEVQENGDISQDYLKVFEPFYAEPKNKIAYDPNSLFKTLTKTKASIPIQPLQKPISESAPSSKRILSNYTSIAKQVNTSPAIQKVKQKPSSFSSVKNAKDKQKTPTKARFDPFTGKPLKSAVKFDPYTGKPIQISENGAIAEPLDIPVKTVKPIEPIKPVAPIPPIVSKEAQTPMDEAKTTSKIPTNVDKISSKEKIEPTPTYPIAKEKVFTVLDPNIRARLLNLSLPEQEKDEISNIFIYLTANQQDKFLSEVEAAQSLTQNELSQYIIELRKLPISESQQNLLIQQFDYIRDDQQQEFFEMLNETKTSVQDETLSSTPEIQEPEVSKVPREIDKPSKTEDESASAEKKSEKDKLQQLQEEKTRLKALKRERERLKEMKEEMGKREEMESQRKERVKELKQKIKESKKDISSTEKKKKKSKT